MELLRTWILTVTVSAVILAVADALMPEGTVKGVGKLTGGLILVLGLLQPLAGLDYQDLYDRVTSFPAGSLTQEDLNREVTAPLEESIERELAAYIAEKGTALGCSCTARVDCIPDENGLPIPEGVVVTGTFTPAQKTALQEEIARDLGIPLANQQYISEETP